MKIPSIKHCFIFPEPIVPSFQYSLTQTAAARLRVSIDLWMLEGRDTGITIVSRQGRPAFQSGRSPQVVWACFDRNSFHILERNHENSHFHPVVVAADGLHGRDACP
jgi:hypothetical protein